MVMFFLLFLCDLVFLCGAKKSLIFGLYHQIPNTSNDLKAKGFAPPRKKSANYATQRKRYKSL
jgi:hypothetical protein